MKRLIVFAALLAVFSNPSIAQQVIIKGTLRCMNNGIATSTRGATNIVIIPSFNPKASVATTTTPQGFFQINTGWDAKELKDKSVSLYIITKCNSCKYLQRIFISQDLERKNTEPDKMYVTIKGWKILENCKQSELQDALSQRLLDSAHRLPATAVDGSAIGSQALGPVGFVNLFQKLAVIAGTGGVGFFKVTSIPPGKIKYGQFLQASAMINTDNTGFNFSSSRNVSEAIFFNAAGIANGTKSSNISWVSNYKNNFKLSGYHQLTKQLYLGIGGIYTKQDEVRIIQYSDNSTPPNSFTPRHPEKLKEAAAFIAPVYVVNSKLSVGVTLKSLWQQFNNPDSFNPVQSGVDIFVDKKISKQHFDADVSFNYNINSFLQAGVSIMNVAGTKLYADMFVDEASAKFINQRSYGVGLTYKRGRLNVGADALITDDDLYDVSLGVNYVPFNNTLVAGGYAFKQKSFSASFRWKYFKIGYIYDNDYMVNDVKVSKNKIFNGRIYSGFVFDF